ncbi:DUF4192 domain-containing protein [Dactylosporangium sp. NPDC051485]|uniref:DUF4192 domain-containing protein n=1 Tax=Dactylosporangium sp. NPDC051485 TaxID=3154846 RepID=UPI0034294F52
MTSTDRPTVRITGPADLLALIPFGLGYQPHSSLVLIVLHETSGIRFGASLSLPGTDEDLQPLRAGLDQVTAKIDSEPGVYVTLAGYGPAEPVQRAVSVATQALHAAGVPTGAVLRVADGRFWHLDCDDPDCCPPEGTSFDPATSPVTAAAVFAGVVAESSRDALAASLAPVTGPARDTMIAATVRSCAFLLELLESAASADGSDPDTALDTPVGRALQGAARTYLTQAMDSYRAGQPIDDEHAATLTVLLDIDSVRDFAAQAATSEPWQLQLWTDLVRRAEPRFSTAPASLLALTAMQTGRMALARVALQRALDADPEYRLAQLLTATIDAGIDPTTVTQLLAG